MDSFFTSIETTTKYDAALAVFLHMLLDISVSQQRGTLDVPDVFTQIRYRADEIKRSHEELYDVFIDPKLISESDAVRLIEAWHQHGDISRKIA
jgi:hypothetical protein